MGLAIGLGGTGGKKGGGKSGDWLEGEEVEDEAEPNRPKGDDGDGGELERPGIKSGGSGVCR